MRLFALVFLLSGCASAGTLRCKPPKLHADYTVTYVTLNNAVVRVDTIQWCK